MARTKAKADPDGIPAWLLVKNRTPLTPDQQARLEQVMSQGGHDQPDRVDWQKPKGMAWDDWDRHVADRAAERAAKHAARAERRAEDKAMQGPAGRKWSPKTLAAELSVGAPARVRRRDVVAALRAGGWQAMPRYAPERRAQAAAIYGAWAKAGGPGKPDDARRAALAAAGVPPPTVQAGRPAAAPPAPAAASGGKPKGGRAKARRAAKRRGRS